MCKTHLTSSALIIYNFIIVFGCELAVYWIRVKLVFESRKRWTYNPSLFYACEHVFVILISSLYYIESCVYARLTWVFWECIESEILKQFHYLASLFIVTFMAGTRVRLWVYNWFIVTFSGTSLMFATKNSSLRRRKEEGFNLFWFYADWSLPMVISRNKIWQC